MSSELVWGSFEVACRVGTTHLNMDPMHEHELLVMGSPLN